MSTYETKPIGEIFEYGKLKLQVVENETCEGCFFESEGALCLLLRDTTGYCGSEVREDRKSVIFKRIDE